MRYKDEGVVRMCLCEGAMGLDWGVEYINELGARVHLHSNDIVACEHCSHATPRFSPD